MEVFKNRTMNLDDGYVNYQSSVKAMLKQAAIKARILVSTIFSSLSEQEEPVKDLTTGRSLTSNKFTTILPKFPQPKNKSTFNSLAKNRSGLRANVIDFQLEKSYTLSENSTDMSPAQIVFAVLHKQQVEWMRETEKESA